MTVKLRRDTAANWVSVNPVLADGQVGIDKTASPRRIKIGDGTTAWNDLPYLDEGQVPVSRTITIDGVTQDLAANRSFTTSGGGGGGEMAKASSFADVDAIVTHFATSDKPVYLDVDVDVPSPKTFPANARFAAAGEGKFVRSGTGAITFAGQAFTDPENARDILSGFVGEMTVQASPLYAGQAALAWPTGSAAYVGSWLTIPELDFQTTITAWNGPGWNGYTLADAIPAEFNYQATFIHSVRFTGTDAPPVISTAVVESASLTDQLRTLAAAFHGKKVEFRADPRTTITANVETADYQSIYFPPGVYQNTLASSGGENRPAFTLGSHSRFHSAGGTIIYESSVANNAWTVRTRLGATDVVIEHNHFKGQGAGGGGAQGVCVLEDATQSHIRYNFFEQPSTYAAGISGGGSATVSDGCTIEFNTFTVTKTQLAYVTRGRRWSVSFNRFLVNGDNVGGGGFGLIDIERNITTDELGDGQIIGNYFDARDIDLAGYAILLQGSEVGAQRVTITGNIVVGDNAGTQTIGGVHAYGWENVTLDDNKFFNVNNAVDILLCSRVSLTGNRVWGANGGIVVHGVYDLKAAGNGMHDGSEIGEGRFYERLYDYPVTVSGAEVDGYPTDFFGNAAVYPSFEGRKVLLNNAQFTISDARLVGGLQPLDITLSASAGTFTAKTITAVSTAADTVTATAHGFVTGARVMVESVGGAFPAGLTPSGIYANNTAAMFAIRIDADTLKFADTYEKAIAGTPLDIGSVGSGTLKLIALMTLYPDANVWDGNDGTMILESPLPSVVGNIPGRHVSTAYAPAQFGGNVNDYDPATKAYRYDLDFQFAGSDLTGLASALPFFDGYIQRREYMEGERHLIYNAGAVSFDIIHESASSSAANRFHNSTGADLSLSPGQAAEVEYNAKLQRWMVFKRG